MCVLLSLGPTQLFTVRCWLLEPLCQPLVWIAGFSVMRWRWHLHLVASMGIITLFILSPAAENLKPHPSEHAPSGPPEREQVASLSGLVRLCVKSTSSTSEYALSLPGFLLALLSHFIMTVGATSHLSPAVTLPL